MDILPFDFCRMTDQQKVRMSLVACSSSAFRLTEGEGVPCHMPIPKFHILRGRFLPKVVPSVYVDQQKEKLSSTEPTPTVPSAFSQ